MTGFGNTLRCAALGLVTLGTLTTAADAATVSGGSLLSASDAGQLDTWLGTGDHAFTNIWSGDAGVGTAASFHAAADGAGPTFSIYEMTIHDGSTALIGGYTNADWGGATGYKVDATAFIFNLTSGEVQSVQSWAQYAVYTHATYFPTFGGGHDLFGGSGILATCGGSVTHPRCDGYTYNHSYDRNQGQISVAGDSGSYGDGDSGNSNDAPVIRSLEVYSIGPIAAVPLPAGLPLLLGAFAMLAMVRRRRSAP